MSNEITHGAAIEAVLRVELLEIENDRLRAENARLLEALKDAADAIESDYAHSIGFLDGSFPAGEPITIDWLEWAKNARAAIAEAETGEADEMCFHECPDCQTRCNCAAQPCEHCAEAEK